MVTAAELIETARRAFARRDWVAAATAFQEVRNAGELVDGADAEALAESLWFLGRIADSLTAFEHAYRRYLDDEKPERAAKAAMYVAAHAKESGDVSRGSGWMSRARRLLRDLPEASEYGYLLYFDTFAALGAGEYETAGEHARRAQELGQTFDDPNLIALGVVGEGRMLVKQGRVAEGLALLDEAMVTALGDELHPLWTGAIYCHLMDVCSELMDLRRAGEWTQASERWCEGLPEAVFFRGVCRVHRAQCLQLWGAWDEAEQLSTRASVELRPVHTAGAADAHYEVGEIHRLRGDLDAADESFRRAHELGHDAQPGLALVRLARGHAGSARASLVAAVAERGDDRLARARLCPAMVEVSLAAGEVEAARAASAELAATATAFDSAGLLAASGQAAGRVLLADGRPADALQALRRSCRFWQDLEVPYEAARTRLLLAAASHMLGDQDAEALELDAARAVFDRLGAAFEPAPPSTPDPGANPPEGLTVREVEVLRQVAEGKTNRSIAKDLQISERTVGSHLSNIFTKLGLSSRAAATAYAFDHALVTRARR